MIEQLEMELELFFSDPPPEATLLSITLPFHRRPFTTPLVPDSGIYWNSRSSGRLLGIGTAWQCRTQGAERFQQLEQARTELLNHWSQIDPEESGHAPPLYLQYAFDPQDPMEQEWSGFANTLLLLPRLLLTSRQGHQFITLSHPVEAQSEPQPLLQQWQQDLQQLETLFTPQPEQEPPTLQPSPQQPSSRALIEHGIESIQRGELEKVVLGHAQPCRLSAPLSPPRALQQLERSNRHGVQLLYAAEEKKLIAAPPEQLLKKTGATVEAEALAGTLPRGETPELERQLEQQLLQDGKLLHEHQLVVDFIEQQLAHHCSSVERPDSPTVHKLEQIQHLLTALQGELKQESTLFELTATLHQSPAICGTPKQSALEWLRQQNNSQRGYYCGGAGWINNAGDGEVHVVLRCALIEAEQATLYAGVGVVDGSDTEEEQREIGLKIQGIARVLSS